MFISCSPLLDGDGALEIFMTTTVDVYEDVMEEWEDLVAGVAIGEGTGIGETRAERDRLAGGRFEDAELGFSFEWDPEAWEAEYIESDEQRGAEMFGEVSYAYIAAWFDTGIEDEAECVDNLVSTFDEIDGVEEMRTAPRRLSRPDTHRDAESALLTFQDTNLDEKQVIYNECRIGDDGTVYTVQFIAPYGDYEDELPLWQETLDSIEIDE